MAARVIIEARAAVCSSTCGCCCKPNIKTSGTRCYRRLISTGNSPLQESYQQNDCTASEPQIPLVPKYRDPHAVLKALSSTVTPVKYPFVMGRSQSDPLAACNLAQQMQFIMAEEAGKKAAEYVINRYPHLFPWKQPIPDLRIKTRQIKEATEDNLKYLITQRNAARALKMFEELQDKGESLSLETQNSLLALLAYNGQSTRTDLPQTSSPVASTEKGEEEQEEEQLVTVVDEAVKIAEEAVEAAGLSHPVKEEEVKEEEEERVFPADDLKEEYPDIMAEGDKLDDSLQEMLLEANMDLHVPEWSSDNPAEKFFAAMPEKDGGSYSAMISGLVKFKNYSRAFSLFDEARGKNLQVDVQAYNQLLTALLDLNIPRRWNRGKRLVAEMSKGSTAVKPNLTTMNLLMQLAHYTGTWSSTATAMVIREMMHLDIKPTLTTLWRLLEADLRSKSHQVLNEVVDYLEANPDILELNEPTDIGFFSLAIKKAKYCSDVALVQRIKKLAMKDNMFLVQHIPFFLSTYLYAITKSSDIELLQSEYLSVVPSMYVPHEWVYELMFRLCTDTKRPDIAMMLWKDMVQYRVEITKPEVLQRAVGALGVSANIDPQESPKFIAAVDHIWVKMLYNEWRPSEFMISVAVKMCAYNNQLDKAWEYYSLFKEYGQKPTFVALSSLLKAHIARGDIDKVTELLDKIISLGFWFPRNFIISICSSLGVSPEEKDRFLEGFEQNWSSRQDSDMYSSDGTEGRDDS